MPNAAYVFNCLEKDTEQTAKMFRDAEKETKKPAITRASAEMSLAHMIRQGYTREQYQNEINFSKLHNRYCKTRWYFIIVYLHSSESSCSLIDID